jgi:predicted transcriptional regulator
MTRSRIERISITLPAELVRWADREAKRLGRPRSWVIAEALRGAAGTGRATLDAGSGMVRETVVSPYAGVEAEMADARDRRLRAALALPAAARLRKAEELLRLAHAVRPRRGRHQIIAFDTFEEFWQWKKAHRVAGAVRS